MLDPWVFGAVFIPKILQILEATHPIFHAHPMKPFMGEKHPHLSCGNRHAIRSFQKDRALHSVRVWHIYLCSLAIFCLQLVGYMVGILPIDFTAAIAKAYIEGPGPKQKAQMAQSNCFVLCARFTAVNAYTGIGVLARC